MVPAMGEICHSHPLHVHDVVRFDISYFLNTRTCSHFGHSACSPSTEKRVRHNHSRQVASSGKSRWNSISDHVDSDEAARFGWLRFTPAIHLMVRERAYTVKG